MKSQWKKQTSMSGTLSVFLVLQIASLAGTVVGGPLCHDCTRIPYPRDCDTVRRCGDHEVCHVEELVSASGVVWYNTGCIEATRCSGVGHRRQVAQRSTSDISVCDNCCDRDFCNTQGCGAQGFTPLSTRGPICFACHQQHNPDTCDYVTLCSRDEVCYLMPKSNAFDVVYQSGCGTPQQCTTLQHIPELVGRRNAADRETRETTVPCFTCCNTDYCNMNCSTVHLGQVSTSPPGPLIPVTSGQPVKPQTSATKTTRLPVVTSAVPSSSTTVAASTVPPDTPTTTAPPISKARCEAAGYQYVDGLGLCYKIHQGALMTWARARSACRREHGDLLVIRDSQTLQYLAAQHFYPTSGTLSEKRYWVGATDLGFEGIWRWVNGSRVLSLDTLFHRGEPNNLYTDKGGENCGTVTYFFDTFKMNDDVCSYYYHFICQINGVIPVKQSCINDDFQYDAGMDLCYKIYHNEARTWDDARKACQGKHGDLLQLRDRSEEDFFSHKIDAHLSQRYWVGGNDRAQEGVFLWNNNQPLSNLTWNPLEPNSYGGNEDCLSYTFSFNVMALNDDLCSKHLSFICEETCTSPDYTFVPDMGLCIKIYADRLSWPDARAVCSLDNADLVIVDTQAKLQYFQKELVAPHHQGEAQYWIGALDRLNTSHYTWVTDRDMVVPNDFWHPGEPYGPGELCVALQFFSSDNVLKLNNADCLGTQQRFICQKIW